MSDDFTLLAAPSLENSDSRLATFAESLADLRPVWSQLGEHLSATTQARWPLRRRTAALRRSLTWTGERLGPGGIFQSKPDRLTFGSRLFYSGFSQHGTRRQPARALIYVEEADIGARLTAWARERATATGLEVS